MQEQDPTNSQSSLAFSIRIFFVEMRLLSTVDLSKVLFRSIYFELPEVIRKFNEGMARWFWDEVTVDEIAVIGAF
jgi:hypothetical protein